MGYPSGAVDWARRDAEALLSQLQSIVDSNLVADDAKLDLVKDYGSNTTVSHHGKWSRWWPSKSENQRSQNIRTAFAKALGVSSGGITPQGTGNAALDKIILKLTNSQKPLTKREVRQVLDQALPLLNLAMAKSAMSDKASLCKEQLRQGNGLLGQVGDLEKKLQNSKVRFTEEEIKLFRENYDKAQNLRSRITDDYNAIFWTDPDLQQMKPTHEEVLAGLAEKSGGGASGKPDESLKLMTFEQLVDEEKRLAGELRKLPKGDKAANGAKDDPKVLETKAKYRAVVGELRQILRTRALEAEKIEQSIPQEIRDRLAVKKEDYQLTMDLIEENKAAFRKNYYAAYPKAKEKKADISIEDAITALRNMTIEVPEGQEGLAESLKAMNLQELEDKLTSLKYDEYSIANDKGEEGTKDKGDGWADVLKDRQTVVEAFWTRAKLLAEAHTATKEIGELKESIPKNVLDAFATNEPIKPDLEQFLASDPGAKEDVGDSAVGAEAAKCRSELLTEIKALKTKLEGWTKAQMSITENADELAWQEPSLGNDVDAYYGQCNDCLIDVNRQGQTLEGIKKKLGELLKRYDATFVEPKKAVEEAKKQEEIKKIQTEIGKTGNEIDNLKKQIDTHKATQQRLTAAGGDEAKVSLDEAKELVLAMQRIYQRKVGEFEKQRVLPSDDKALQNLQAEISDLKTRIESNEKLIAEKWTAPIKDLEKQIAEKEGQVKDLQKKQDDVQNGRVEKPKLKIVEKKEEKIAEKPKEQKIEIKEEVVKNEEKPKEEKKVEEKKPEEKKVEIKEELKVPENNVENVNKPQDKYVFKDDEKIVFDSERKGFFISTKWINDKAGNKSDSANVISAKILDKIPDFEGRINSLKFKQEVCKSLEMTRGLANRYFDFIWADFIGKDLKGMISNELVDVLRDQRKPGEFITTDKMMDLVRQGIVNKFEREEAVSIGQAEEKLKALTTGAGSQALNQLSSDFEEWKKKELGSVKTIIGENACKTFEEQVLNSIFKLLESEVKKGSLASIAFSKESEEITLFHHLVGTLSDDTKSLFDTIKRDLEITLERYKLVHENAKNIGPKLTMPSGDVKEEPRIKQGPDDSPQKIINAALQKKVGLLQEGDNSCWMISVVNGLLATGRGSEILQKCFENPNMCVFNARTIDGGISKITVPKDEIEKAMEKARRANIKLSKLEAAIWCGVNKMARANDGVLFGVQGRALGAEGEATEAALLFGLSNVGTGEGDRTGKSVKDNNVSWVSGANALQQGKVVVLHKKSNSKNQRQQVKHFITAVGTIFDDTNAKTGNAPKKAFCVYDSVASWRTKMLTSDSLNVDEKSEGDIYEVQAYELPTPPKSAEGDAYK